MSTQIITDRIVPIQSGDEIPEEFWSDFLDSYVVIEEFLNDRNFFNFNGLWFSLSETVRMPEDSKFDGVITLSNTGAIVVTICDSDGDDYGPDFGEYLLVGVLS